MADVNVNQYRVAASVNSTGTQNNRFAFCATTHTQAETKAAGYFNNVRHLMSSGDVIECTCGIGGTMKSSRLRVATVPATGNVTTTPIFEEA